MDELKKYINKIRQGSVLKTEEMRTCMNVIMEGGASEAQIGALLMGLSQRGETAEEMTGAALTLREKALSIQAPADAVDCCGTGGDGLHSYNISTAVALVAAACGVPVAKHGNRAVSSKSGAADVLAALGVNLELDKEALETALRDLRFCFLLAPRHHTAMKHVASIRRDLGFRTIFNIVGPLASPAAARAQLIGVYDKALLIPMAETLKALGARRAWVVHGEDGMDEITTTAPTDIVRLSEDGEIISDRLTPEDFGLNRASPEDLKGGDAQENAQALRAVLEGAPGPYRDIVAANCAAVLAVHDGNRDLKAQIKRAAEAIDQGRALSVLESYIAFSRAHALTQEPSPDQEKAFPQEHRS